HLAKTAPGPRGRRTPSRRLVGAQRFIEFSKGFGGLSQSQLRRGGVRSEPRRDAVVLQGGQQLALLRRLVSSVDRRAGLARHPASGEQSDQAESAEHRHPRPSTTHLPAIAWAREPDKQSFSVAPRGAKRAMRTSRWGGFAGAHLRRRRRAILTVPT